MALYVTNNYVLSDKTPQNVLTEYREALVEFVRFVQEKQPGTWMYTVLEDTSNQYRFTHFAIYQDAESRKSHTSEGYHKKIKKIVEPYLEPPGFAATEYNMLASQTVFSKCK